MTCPHLIELLPNGVRCRKNGGSETTCSHGVCWHCADGGGQGAAWKTAPTPHRNIAHRAAATGTEAAVPKTGPGTELKKLLATLGVNEAIDPTTGKPSCRCQTLAAQMDAWGVAGCQEHADEIIAHLGREADTRGWAVKLRVGITACITMPGLALAGVLGMESAFRWLLRRAWENTPI